MDGYHIEGFSYINEIGIPSSTEYVTVTINFNTPYKNNYFSSLTIDTDTTNKSNTFIAVLRVHNLSNMQVNVWRNTTLSGDSRPTLRYMTYGY